MYFKRLLVLLLLAPLALAGCGLKIGEKAPEPIPVSYTGKNFSCVSEVPQHIQKYMNDELSDAEITDFVRCLQNAFSSFAQYTRGREQSNYRADEIRNFLQKSFIRDRTITDELLHEFMVIKVALVGGDEARIARSELFDAIGFLEDLRLEAIRLRPHIRVLNPKLVGDEDPALVAQRLAEANAALKLSIKTVAGHLEKSKRDYPLANLGAFLTEFREFVKWEDHFKNARPVADWIALLKAFKDATVSPVEPDIIHDRDWVPLLESMSDWYITYLQYRIGIKGRPVLYGTGLDNILYLANQIFNHTRGAVKSQGGPAPTLSFGQVNRLVIALRDIGWIPEYVRPESVDQAVRALTTRMAGEATTKPSERRAQGIDFKTLTTLESEFYRWAYVQVTLDNRYHVQSSAGPKTVPNLQMPMMGLPQDVIAKMENMSGSEYDEFDKVRMLMQPLFPDGVPRVEIVPKDQLAANGVTQGFYNLSAMNILRSSVALVFRGYSETSAGRWLWESGIQGPEMQAFYVDFRNLGIDFGIIDKRNTNSGSRAFVEGKLFTSSSKGLDYNPAVPESGELSFVETMEYFAYLYSGGEMAKEAFSQLAADCGEPGPADINGLPKVLRSCALRDMPAVIARYMGNMPHLQKYLASLPPPEQVNYVQIMFDTAFQPGSSDEKWLEKNEISTLAVVLHYAESIMTRFDHNEDGILDNSELVDSVPIFAGFIKKIAHDKMGRDLSDKQARAALFYILAYKNIPVSATDFAYVFRYEVWEPTLRLDRTELAEVFKAIIARLFEVGTKPLPAPMVPVSAALPAPGDLSRVLTTRLKKQFENCAASVCD